MIVENYKLKTLLYLIKLQSNFLEEKKKQTKIKPRSGLYILRLTLANA